MGKIKLTIGIILIAIGVFSLFFSIGLGILLISAGVSSVVFGNEEDEDSEIKKKKS